METQETIRVYIRTATLEPGTHIMRKHIATGPKVYFELPASECMEIRADWGQYLPVVTRPAIERALRKRGAFPCLPVNQEYMVGYVVEPVA